MENKSWPIKLMQIMKPINNSFFISYMYPFNTSSHSDIGMLFWHKSSYTTWPKFWSNLSAWFVVNYKHIKQALFHQFVAKMKNNSLYILFTIPVYPPQGRPSLHGLKYRQYQYVQLIRPSDTNIAHMKQLITADIAEFDTKWLQSILMPILRLQTLLLAISH